MEKRIERFFEGKFWNADYILGYVHELLNGYFSSSWKGLDPGFVASLNQFEIPAASSTPAPDLDPDKSRLHAATETELLALAGARMIMSYVLRGYKMPAKSRKKSA